MKKILFAFIIVYTSIQTMERELFWSLQHLPKKNNEQLLTFEHFKNLVGDAIQQCSTIEDTEKRFIMWKKNYEDLLSLLPNDTQSLDTLLTHANEKNYNNSIFLFLVHIKRKTSYSSQTLSSNLSTDQSEAIELKSQKIKSADEEKFQDFVTQAATNYGLILPYTEFAKKIWKTGEISIQKITSDYYLIKEKKITMGPFEFMHENYTTFDMQYLFLLPKAQKISYLWLSEIPEQLNNLVGLQLLKFNSKQSIALPKYLSLKNLKILNLSDNKFRKLPDSLNKLTSLEILLAQNNELKKDPMEVIAKLKNLKYLDLSNNKLQTINLKKISAGFISLRLHKNQLKKAPSFKSCKQLEYVTLNDNPLDSNNFPYNELIMLPKLKEFTDCHGKLIKIKN